jgi:hypothetical protein
MDNENKWSLKLSFDNKNYLYEWSEYFHEGKSFGYFAKVLDEETRKELRYTPESEAVIKAAVAFRVSQIREETKNSIPENGKSKKLILEYAERARNGEFLGQYNDQTLFVQEVAKLLDFSFSYTFDFVQELIQEQKIGLNGNILIPYEDYIATFTYLYKRTGHKLLSVSDWGYWGCQACSKHGDPDDPNTADPSKVPCVPSIEK